MNSILCDICNKPICSRFGKSEFRRHFRRMHPSVQISHGLENRMTNTIKRKPMTKYSIKYKQSKKVQCNYCNTVLLSGNLMRHLSELHSLNKILCPLKDCTFGAKRVNKLREHWNKKHTCLRFPEIRMRYVFTYPVAIATTSNNNDEKNVSNKRILN